MTASFEGHYERCPRVGHAVNVSQTEGACRDKHGCNGDRCPLESDFKSGSMGRTLSLLSAAISGALPLGKS